MHIRHLIALIAAILVGLTGCSSQSPLTPDAVSNSTRPDGVNAVQAAARVLQPATYVISFVDSSRQPITGLPVCDGELFLKAHVESSGAPVQEGAVIFEYCSYKRLPPNDITRADEAPLEKCQTGEASWDRLSRGNEVLDESGDAYEFFGAVRIPRTVGFRFRYVAQGSEFEPGVSPPENFTFGPGTCPP
jgi:hypothetical protein